MLITVVCDRGSGEIALEYLSIYLQYTKKKFDKERNCKEHPAETHLFQWNSRILLNVF